MKRLLTIALFFSTFASVAQSIDFGIDVRINNNIFTNRFGNNDVNLYPGYQSDNPNDLTIPASNFTFLDDYGNEVNVRFDNVRVENNFVLPLYFRFTTASNWFFDVELSSGRFRIESDGRLFANQSYYLDTYGSYNEVGDSFTQFEDDPVNEGSENYSASGAYINWFNNKIEDDFYNQFAPKYVEEFKYRSIMLGFGRKFLRHKKLHPYFNMGLGYRFATSNYSFRHFEVDEAKSGVRRDLSALTDDLPQFSKHSFAMRFGVGAEIYRYHFGFMTDYSFNLTTSFKDKAELIEYKNSGIGFGSASLYVGLDLFDVDLNAKNHKKEVYNDEYKEMSSSLRKRRSWSVGVNVKSPMASRVNADEPYTIVRQRDQVDTASGLINKSWHSITFGEVSRVSWVPNIQFSLRIGLARWLDLEWVTGFTRYRIDHKLEDFRTTVLADPSAPGGFVLDSAGTSLNRGVYRSSNGPFGFGLNLYFTVVSNGFIDFRLYGGATGWLNSSSKPGPAREFGVNGDGKDVYQDWENYHHYLDPEEFNGKTTYYSSYAGDVDLDQSDYQIIQNYKSNDWNTLEDYKEVSKSTLGYWVANFGWELEMNRILVGMSGEFSFTQVDAHFVKNYFNLNFNLGYLLFTKYKRDKKVRD